MTDFEEMIGIIHASLNTTHLGLKFLYDHARAGTTPTPLDLAAVAYLIEGSDKLTGTATPAQGKRMILQVQKHLQERH